MPENKKRLTYIISIAAVFGVLILVSLGFYLSGLTSSNSDGSISIKNYDDYVKNLSSDERKAIEKALYDTVSYNISDAEKIKSINDASIRNDTYSQKLLNGSYTTTFIVDMESIGQSYHVQNLYSRLNVEDSDLRDYTSLVTCLEKDKLKYGEFTCRDRLSEEAGVTKSDPVLQYLPVSTLDYTLSQDINSKELKLFADLELTEIDYKLGEEEAIARYKTEIAAWFESKGLDINKYSITYHY